MDRHGCSGAREGSVAVQIQVRLLFMFDKWGCKSAHMLRNDVVWGGYDSRLLKIIGLFCNRDL